MIESFRVQVEMRDTQELLKKLTTTLEATTLVRARTRAWPRVPHPPPSLATCSQSSLRVDNKLQRQRARMESMRTRSLTAYRKMKHADGL